MFLNSIMQLNLLGTPCSNTGLDSQPSTLLPFSPNTPILAIDNVSLMWDELDGFDILPFARDLLDVDFDFSCSYPIRIGVVWENCYRGSLGCLYMFRRTERGTRYRLSLSGKACSRVPLDLLLRFFEVIHHNNVDLVCSRMDICLDDYSKKLTFDNLCAALDSKNYSGFRGGRSVRNHDDSGGWTVYLGSRESNHFVRVYNKAAESKGRIDAIRWESEFKSDKADYIFRKLALQKTSVAAVAHLELYVFGNFDFIYKNQKNLERCDRLTWWEDFLAWVGFGRAKILVVKAKTSIESRVIWIKKQVEKSLALLSRAFGSDDFQLFMDERVASGSQRLRRCDDTLLSDYLKAQVAF